MIIALASDHGGFTLKEDIKNYLITEGHVVLDCGTDSLESCDYSKFGIAAAELVRDKKAERGIVICTSGEGIMISANKVKSIRCGLVYNKEVAQLIRLHNDCNMMSLGAKFVTKEEAFEYVDIFLDTPFEGGRHNKRVSIISDYEGK